MKTTMVLDDTVVARLKQKSPLPAFDGGGCVADVADRDALYQAMEGR